MTPFDYTIITTGCMMLTSWISYQIGSRVGYIAGFEMGSHGAIGALLTALKSQFGMEVNYDLVIQDEDYENPEEQQ